MKVDEPIAYPNDTADIILIKTLQMMIRCYYQWKKDVFDADGNKFDPDNEDWKMIPYYEQVLQMMGYHYNQENDTFHIFQEDAKNG